MKGLPHISLLVFLIVVLSALTTYTCIVKPLLGTPPISGLASTDGPLDPNPALLPSPTCRPVTPTPYVGADGKLYMGVTQVFDPMAASPTCDGVGQISASPSGQYFMVVMDCPEGSNDAYLFNADSSKVTRITGQYDYVKFFQFQWSKDEKYLFYTRVNSCCLSASEIPTDAPKAGKVRYDLLTGEKILAP